MDLTRPLAAVSPSLQGAVLTVLAEADAHDEWLSGRRVAARIPDRGSQEGVRRVLDALATSGIVVKEARHRPAILYRLNAEHIATPHLLAIHRIRDELLSRMRALIEAWEIRPVSAILFGTVARNDARTDSDVDILLVRESTVAYSGGPWSPQFGDLHRRVASWTGSYVSVIDYTTEGWAEALGIDDPFVDEVEKDGITLAGLSPRQLRDACLRPKGPQHDPTAARVTESAARRTRSKARTTTTKPAATLLG